MSPTAASPPVRDGRLADHEQARKAALLSSLPRCGQDGDRRRRGTRHLAIHPRRRTGSRGHRRTHIGHPYATKTNRIAGLRRPAVNVPEPTHIHRVPARTTAPDAKLLWPLIGIRSGAVDHIEIRAFAGLEIDIDAPRSRRRRSNAQDAGILVRDRHHRPALLGHKDVVAKLGHLPERPAVFVFLPGGDAPRGHPANIFEKTILGEEVV